MRAEKTHDFWGSPGRDFLYPGSPKMNTNQQDNLQKNNKKKTTYSRYLQNIIQRLSADRLCARRGRTAVANPNTPRARSGPVRIFGAVRGVRGAVELFTLRDSADPILDP